MKLTKKEPKKPKVPKPGMNKASENLGRLVQDSKAYADAKIDDVKLKTVKGLSQGSSTLARMLLYFAIGSAMVMALAFAFVLLLGELIGSYALAAFIVAGVLALALVVIFLIRDKLFRDSFVPMFADLFFPKEEEEEKHE